MQVVAVYLTNTSQLCHLLGGVNDTTRGVAEIKQYVTLYDEALHGRMHAEW